MNILSEFQSLISPLTSDEFAQLEKNCIEHGITDPLIIAVWPDENGEEQKYLADGHNRLKIAEKQGLAFETVERFFDSKDAAKLWMIMHQLGRRNLEHWQKAKLALVAEPLITESAKKNMLSTQNNDSSSAYQIVGKQVHTDKDLAEIAGVSHYTMHKARKLNDHADETTKEMLNTGEISISKAYNDMSNPSFCFDIRGCHFDFNFN
jgi:hypothetical protein